MFRAVARSGYLFAFQASWNGRGAPHGAGRSGEHEPLSHGDSWAGFGKTWLRGLHPSRSWSDILPNLPEEVLVAAGLRYAGLPDSQPKGRAKTDHTPDSANGLQVNQVAILSCKYDDACASPSSYFHLASGILKMFDSHPLAKFPDTACPRPGLVPEGHTTIAQRFSVGCHYLKRLSPEGTSEIESPVSRPFDFFLLAGNSSDEVLDYFHSSLLEIIAGR